MSKTYVVSEDEIIEFSSVEKAQEYLDEKYRELVEKFALLSKGDMEVKI